MGKRDNAILELLASKGRLEVTAIADELNVSQVTVRKDLDALEKRGILHREHGYAIPGSSDDMNNRMAFNYEAKRLIAREAARLVRDGETVMIENGSCCALLAEEIVRTKQNVTIITNSAFIAAYIRQQPDAKVILLGGNFQNNAQVMVGPMVRLCASQFRVDKLFVGIDGFNDIDGFMADDYLRVQAVRDMSERADKLVVVTESKKFERTSLVSFGVEGCKKLLVTDSALNADAQQKLEAMDIEIHKANAYTIGRSPR